MSSITLVSSRTVDRTDSVDAREDVAIQMAGGEVVANLDHGKLVAGNPDELKALNARGYRTITYEDTHLMQVGAHTIDINDGIQGLSRSQRVPSRMRDAWQQHLVQLIAPPDPAWIAAIEARDLIVAERIGAYGLLILGDSRVVRELTESEPFARWSGALEPGLKIHPGLEALSGSIEHVRVAVQPAEEIDAVRSRLDQLGATVAQVIAPPADYHAEPAFLLVRIQKRRLNLLAQHPFVRALEYAGTKAGLDGEREVQILAENTNGAGAAAAPQVGYQNYLANTVQFDGTGVNVAIVDTGVDDNANNNATGHLDLRGRQVASIDYTGGTATTDTHGHGTHVAGIAVGNGATTTTEGAAPNNFLWGQGAAPAAGYITQNALLGAAWPPAGGWQQLTRDAVTNSADVMNNSWWDGSTTAPTPGGYNANARTFDQLVRDPDPTTNPRENLCIVFSAGNWGGANGTISPPHEAKNPIIVGNSLTSRPGVRFNSEDIRGISEHSSRGPAADGRILPTVVAPGTDVSSTRSGNASTGNTIAGTAGANPYGYRSGTSMAAPHVSGACALLTEWMRDRTGRDPSPAMLKALLVNGAEDLAGGPNWRRLRSERWTAAGANVQITNLGFTPQQIVEWTAANTQTAYAQVGSVAQVNAAGRWFYNAATDTLTVRPLNAAAPGNNWVTALDAAALPNVPNNHQGWGRVSIPNMMLQSPASDRGPKIFSDQRHAFSANGQEVLFRIAPVDTSRPMRITLTWTDAPGGINANPALVNNLNLEVTQTSNNNIFRGNVFSNGFSTTGGGFDTTNNVECVFVQNPSGTYEVRVLATNLNANARPPYNNTPWQDFAIVMDNAEYAEADPVGVALLLDRSGSMVTSSYVDTTRQSSRQFVDLMGIDDRVGVVSFGDTGDVEYDDGSGGLQLIDDPAIRTAAKTAINTINFGGCTFMGDGIEKAAALIGASVNRRAIVMFSDGYDNKGCDNSNAAKPSATSAASALPNGLEVYTCAMGPLSDQSTLEQVATLTGGRYFYMPTIDDLHEIYNYIRAQVTDDGLIVNTSSTASSSRVAGIVDDTVTEVTFTVAWEKNLRYVNRKAMKPNEILVQLRDPAGKLVSPDAADIHRVVGEGYVLYRIQNPTPGRWFMEVQTAREDHTRYTAAGFVRSPIRMVLDRPKILKLGQDIDLGLSIRNGLLNIKDLRTVATATALRLDLQNIHERLADRLRTIKPDPTWLADGVPADIARLGALLQADASASKLLSPTLSKASVGLKTATATAPSTGNGIRVSRGGSLSTVSTGLSGTVLSAGLSSATLSTASSLTHPIATIFRPDIFRPDFSRFFPKLPSQTHRVTHTPKVRGSHNVAVKAQGKTPGGHAFVRVGLASVLVK